MQDMLDRYYEGLISKGEVLSYLAGLMMVIEERETHNAWRSAGMI